MDKTYPLSTDLFILYDIASFSFPEKEEDLISQLIEKSTRLFGACRLALITGPKNARKITGYFGFQKEGDIWKAIEKKTANSFLYPLGSGKLGLLYLEQLSPLSLRDRRLYTIFARRIEEILRVKHLEWEQRELEKRKVREQQLLLDSIPIQIWYLKDEKTYGAANKAHAQFLGKKKEELVNKSLFEIARTGEEARAWINENKKAFTKKQQIYTEQWMYNSKGQKRLLAVFKTPTFDINGNVEYVICSALDITERKQAEEQIRYLSFHDKVTRIYNRAYFEEELKRLDTERQLPLSIIIGDVNGLKLVNDTFGHQQGDVLLKKIACVLRNSCRKEDIIARWGGDEFAVLLPRTGNKAAAEVCQRIKKACSETEQSPIRPSIALGTATKEKPDQDIQEILKEAEDRMYRQKLFESKSVRSSIISSLKKILQEKTHETEEHALRVQEMALHLGQKLNLPDNQLDDLSLLAVLHDIGKVAIPNSILAKPGKLTPEEWETIQRHPEIGYRIAQSSPELTHIAEAILAHHEWWDGSGYPRGLKGEEIPLNSRIIAIADAYDVMTRGRPHKKTIKPQEAIEEIKRCAGSQFDPHLVNLFIELIPEANCPGTACPS